MMNPQYPPPGQNNNAPNNPLYPPTSQDYNGVQNANIYNQMPTNGPPKTFDSSEMSQKMQNMNLNGSQGFQTIPTAQMPPGANFPPSSNFGPGQMPPGAYPPSRPPVSGASQFPTAQKPMPPSSTPGPGPQYQMPPQSQTPDQNRQPPMQGRPQPNPMGPPPMGPPGSQGQMPPGSQGQMPPGSQGQMPPGSQGQMPPGLQGQMTPSSQSGLPSQAGPTGRPGLPQQSSKPGIQPSGQPGFQQPGQQQHPGLSPQPGQVPVLPGLPPQQSQLGMPSHSLQGQMPSQPGQAMPPQIGQPRMPPQPGPPGQSGLQPQFMQPGLPQQPGQPSGLQLGQIPNQSPDLPQQPGMPPQQGMPPQPGTLSQQRGLPPQPGQQPGLPPQPQGMPSQANLPSQPGPPGGPPSSQAQYNQMHGLPHMPPPLSAQQGPYPGAVSQQPGFQKPQQSSGGYPGMPPTSSQSMPPMPNQGMPPMPNQGMPPMPNQGMPPMPNQGMPPMPNQGMPPMPNQGMPPMPNQGMPPMPNQGMPPMPNQGMPPMPNQGMQNQGPGYGAPASGYPPQYAPPYPAQQPAYPGQQFQQQKRLDPDQMPSPIQVMADDQANRGGVFVTNDKGLVPPLVTTDFQVDDKGNASPRYVRASMYAVPVTQDLLKQTAMPLCLVISPMAEPEGAEAAPPLLDLAALTGSAGMGPVRCSRCKAYMCPNMKFVDAGRHFKCAFCKATTEVPMEYTQYVNSMQQYGRVPAEMALGAYEIVATKEYCRNNTMPNPPAIVFVIDVSYNSVKSGLLQTLCDNIMNIIESMPKDEQTGKSWTRVGFITYSSTVHFYNIKGSLGAPQMLSVGDVGDMFVPLLEGFLSRPEDSGPVLPQLLAQLPALFRDNKETETILLPAVQAGLEALKAADTSGQLMVFHTSLPSLAAPGKLINREDRKLLATEKEKQILSPQTTAYNELGQACSAAGVSVELFTCNNSYVDAATVGQLPRLTGGQIHKYTYFTAETDGARLVWDVTRAASRPTAHDAVMRVRTSTGVRATDFYGHFFMSNTTDVELAAIDADKAIGIELKHDDKLTAEEGVFVQAALLYTHRSGQRRLRVLNLALAVAAQLADAYRAMELDTTVNFLTKQAVWALREQSPRAVREALSARCARSLAAYRRHCASPSSAGQLVLPESMKLLPLYTSCVLRSDALAGGPDITCDDRSCAMYRALTADVSTSVVYTYPRLVPLHRLQPGQPASLPQLRASIDKMNDHGVYLLENGVHMLIWVGGNAPSEWVRDVFGVAAPHLVDTQVCELPDTGAPLSAAVRALLARIRRQRRLAMRLTVMRQHDKLEAVLRHFLVEDRGVDGSASYVDYLCHVHKEIRALL